VPILLIVAFTFSAFADPFSFSVLAIMDVLHMKRSRAPDTTSDVSFLLITLFPALSKETAS
jgi:hypothetical protein